jgi:Protein of unknown function (DUF3050)
MISDLRAAVAAGRKEVIGHPLYSRLTTEAAVITFMEHHVWAVWDFMSLLKSLQQQLTCTEVPWVPTKTPRARRLVNEIVLAEESDEVGDGYLSHFELYLTAMAQAGADTGPITRFTGLLGRGTSVPAALAEVRPPHPAATFLTDTFYLVVTGPLHARAAAFAFSREDLIPEMFEQVVSLGAGRLGIFTDYLERHIATDADVHSPMALAMVEELCGDSPARWADAQTAVLRALTARRALWDGVYAAIEAQ